jgi:hypothetical protein
VGLVHDLPGEDRASVFGLHLHPLEGHGVSIAEFASHHYAVDYLRAFLAYDQSLRSRLIPRFDEPVNAIGAGLCRILLRTSENVTSRRVNKRHARRHPTTSGVPLTSKLILGGSTWVTPRRCSTRSRRSS